LETHFIDVKANCDPTACAITDTPLTLDTPFPGLIVFFNDETMTRRFFENMLLSSGIPSSEKELTIVEHYSSLAFLNDGWFGPGLNSPVGFDSNANFSTISTGWARALSQGVSSLMNTYIAASQDDGPLVDPCLESLL
jgi:hypothetical protein